ncbi:hypothetical protein P3L10_000603 [Capsicum annuum]
MEALKKYVTSQASKFMVNETANSYTYFGDNGNGIFDNYDIKPLRTVLTSNDLPSHSFAETFWFWKNEIIYENDKRDGIVVSESVSYFRLISVIAVELEIDLAKKNIDIRYVVDRNTAPMIIRNDNSVKVYIELIKICTDFVMYPLCITTSDKSTEEREFDAKTGAIMCVEGTKSDAAALDVVESNNRYSLYVPKIETRKFITDCQNTEVKVKQLYKNKKTLKAVMKKYVLDHSFNFRASRFDKKSY